MRTFISIFLFIFPVLLLGQQNNPVMHWGFENSVNRNIAESPGSITDTIEGNYEIAPGIKGNGLRFDGFTTCVIRDQKDMVSPGNNFINIFHRLVRFDLFCHKIG